MGGGGGQSQLLFFLSPSCPVCKKLLPILKSVAGTEHAWLRIVLASDGEMPEHLAFYRQAGLERFPYLLSTELGMKFQISKLPYAVLIDESGTIRAKGLVNSANSWKAFSPPRNWAWRRCRNSWPPARP